MKYEDMSDFEINKLVAGKVFDMSEWVCVSSWSDGDFVAKLANHTQEKFDPCGNPSDSWPIIADNKIAIDFIDGYGWTANPAFNCSISVSCYDEPLRAAMICFLKNEGCLIMKNVQMRINPELYAKFKLVDGESNNERMAKLLIDSQEKYVLIRDVSYYKETANQ